MYLFILFFFIVALYNPIIGGFNLSNYVIAFGLVIILTLKNIKIKVFNFKNSYMILSMIFFIYIMITDLISIDKSNSIVVTAKFVVPLIFIVLLQNIITSKEKLDKLINIIVFSGGLASLYGCIQYRYGLSDYRLMSIDGVVIYRVLGAFKQANVFASYLVLIIPFMLYKLISAKRLIMKFIFTLIFVITLTATYLTYSRWAIVSLAISFAIFFIIKGIKMLLNRNRKIKKSIYLKIGTLMALMPMLFWLINKIYTKTFDTVSMLFLNRNSSDIRQTSLMFALNHASENLLGYGLGNGNSGIVMDSMYVNVLLDLGLIGIVAFLILLAFLIIRVYKLCITNVSLRNINVILGISFLTFSINGILENLLYNSVLNVFLGFYVFMFFSNKEVLISESTEKIVKRKKKYFKLSFR